MGKVINGLHLNSWLKKRYKMIIRQAMLFFVMMGFTCTPVMAQGQKNPVESYIANFYAMLNNLGDASSNMEERSYFREELMTNFFDEEESMLWNDLRPGGTKYIRAREYLNNLIIDHPRGISFEFGDLTKGPIESTEQGFKMVVSLRHRALPAGGNPIVSRIKLVLAIKSIATSTISARIKSMDEYAGDNPDRPLAPTGEVGLSDGMVYVAGGVFEMGSSSGEDNEVPVHSVTLSSYYLARYEVTLGEFKKFVTATGYVTDAERKGGSYFWNGKWELKSGVNWRHDALGVERGSGEANHPVIHVSWNDAVAYCNWRSREAGLREVYQIAGSEVKADWSANGYRLPTEAEWEYAARSRGKAYTYAWGNGSPNGNVADETAKKTYSNWQVFEGFTDGYVHTSPVGKFSQGELGLYDMTGNVWEWCWDWYGAYSSGTQTDPKGPGTGTNRVGRGGSWGSNVRNCRVSYRNDSVPTYRFINIGFRLARSSNQ